MGERDHLSLKRPRSNNAPPFITDLRYPAQCPPRIEASMRGRFCVGFMSVLVGFRRFSVTPTGAQALDLSTLTHQSTARKPEKIFFVVTPRPDPRTQPL